MSQPYQNACRNRLLAAMAPTDFALVQPHLKLATLALGEQLLKPNTPIEAVHFIEHGIMSCIALATDGEKIELGLVGREGFVGIPVLLGAEQTPDEVRVQAAGLALSLPVRALLDALERSLSLRVLLLRYAQVTHIQAACTALANGRYKVERRLARWLLMCHDRSEDDVLPATQQFLSLMLGVNRPGLTAVIRSFVRDGLILTKRGNITICNRSGLLTLAGAAYGQPEAEYERLLGRSGV